MKTELTSPTQRRNIKIKTHVMRVTGTLTVSIECHTLICKVNTGQI